MSAGTKVAIAIVVLFAAVLGVYYGFGGPAEEGLGIAAAEAEPVQEVFEAQEQASPPVAQPPAASAMPRGTLTRAVEQALRAEGLDTRSSGSGEPQDAGTPSDLGDAPPLGSAPGLIRRGPVMLPPSSR